VRALPEIDWHDLLAVASFFYVEPPEAQEQQAVDAQRDYPVWLGWLHRILDLVGYIPVVGDTVDLAHAGMYLAEAAYWRSQGQDALALQASLGAGVSLVSPLTLIGDTAKGLNWSPN